MTYKMAKDKAEKGSVAEELYREYEVEPDTPLFGMLNGFSVDSDLRKFSGNIYLDIQDLLLNVQHLEAFAIREYVKGEGKRRANMGWLISYLSSIREVLSPFENLPEEGVERYLNAQLEWRR